MRLVLQPCSDSEALDHYTDTIKTPVPLSRILPYLSSIDQEAVSGTFGESVAVWGVTKAKNNSNAKQWGEMQLGDVVLIYGNKRFFCRGVVAFKVHSPELALDLWQTQKDGTTTWEYIFFLTDLEPVDIPIASFIRAAVYKSNYVVQRFTVLKEKESEAICAALDLAEPSGARAYTEADIEGLKKTLEHLPDDLDSPTIGKRRKEQASLRNLLLGRKRVESCALCGRSLPLDLLFIGHIKKRHSCSSADKKNLQNVMVVCSLGCDRLFENGYVWVGDSGKVCATRMTGIPSDLKAELERISGRVCSAWNRESELYFDWHRRNLKVVA